MNVSCAIGPDISFTVTEQLLSLLCFFLLSQQLRAQGSAFSQTAWSSSSPAQIRSTDTINSGLFDKYARPTE